MLGGVCVSGLWEGVCVSGLWEGVCKWTGRVYV